METKTKPDPPAEPNDLRAAYVAREQVRVGISNMLENVREMLLIFLEQFPPQKQLEIISRGSASIETHETGSYIILTNRLRADMPALPPDPVQKFGRPDYISFDAIAARIPTDEPVMIFRAQDELLPEVAEFYAALLQGKGGDLHLVNLAVQHANRVRDWQTGNDTKSADLPAEEERTDKK